MPDLTLPPHAPSKIERYREGSYSLLPTAVYAIVDLGPGGGEALIRALEARDENVRDTCRLVTDSTFAGQPLRAAYDYHLEHVAPSRSCHPTLFIVSVSPDSQKHGVLLVNLDADVEGRIDTCRLSIDDAALDAVNLKIGNEDWEEVKDHGWSDEIEGASGAAEPSSTTASPSTSTEHPSHPPIFAVYSTVGADMIALQHELEPGWTKKALPQRRCRMICNYAGSPDPDQEMISKHPWCCWRTQGSVHPQLFICADRPDVQRDGVALVKMDWDGRVDRDPNELFRMAPEYSVDRQRCPPADALARLTSIARGERPWEGNP